MDSYFIDAKQFFLESAIEAIVIGDIDETKQWLNLAPWEPAGLGNLLLVAVSANQREVVEALLVRGAKTDYIDTLGNTALSLAIRFNFTEIVNRLLEFSTSVINTPNDSGWTPLHFAALSGNVSTYDKLLVMGANYCVEVQDQDACTLFSKEMQVQNGFYNLLRKNPKNTLSILSQESQIKGIFSKVLHSEEANKMKQAIQASKWQLPECQINARQNSEKRKSILDKLIQTESIHMQRLEGEYNDLSSSSQTGCDIGESPTSTVYRF